MSTFTNQTARLAEAQNKKHGAKGAMTPAAARAAKAPTAAQIRVQAVPINPGERNRK